MRLVVVLVCSMPLAAESLLPVVSAKEGRKYLIDLDKFEVQQAMEAVSQPAAGPSALSLPAWLPPYPGAIQETGRFSPLHSLPKHKDLKQRYYAPGTAEQIMAYYQAAVQRAGLPELKPMRTATGMTLHVNHLSEWAVVTARPRAAGGCDLTISYTVKSQGTFNSARKFDAVWYDDNAGVLRLRERASGQEFNLRREAIARFDVSLNRAVQATLDELPAWIPRYPGAAVVRAAAGSQSVHDTPAVATRFRTRDSVDAVWDYYLQALPRAGLSIVGQSRNRSGGFLADSKLIGVNALNQSVEVAISKNLEMPGLPVPVRGTSTGGIPTMTWKTSKQGGGTSIAITFRVHLPKQGKAR